MGLSPAIKKLTAAFLTVAALALPAEAAAQSQFYGGPGGYTGVVAPPQVISGAPYFYPAGHPLAPRSMADVDVRLVLVLDASGSLTDEEYKIEIEVTAGALTDPNVIDSWFGAGPLRQTGPIGSIAIAVVDFGDGSDLRVPWVDFRADDPDLEERLALYAMEIEQLVFKRDYSKKSYTHIGNMLYNMPAVFAGAPWKSQLRDVIDVFSDGTNQGRQTDEPRKILALQGVTINALAIVNDDTPNLESIYRSSLVTQPEDIPVEQLGVVVPGRVWAVARDMKSENNGRQEIVSFGREVQMAFRSKIVWETTMVLLPY